MERINLIIKLKGMFLCEQVRDEINFIHVPNYFDQEPLSNISIFITLLFHGLLDQNYYSKIDLPDMEWERLFEEAFVPDYFFQVSDNAFLYDIDELLNDNLLPQENVLKLLPSQFVFLSGDENQILKSSQDNYEGEEIPYGYHDSITFINGELLTLIKKLKIPRSDKDVLLMYSGGKDSTLAAIRLIKMGYHVHLLHFDNGHMRDSNKPFLTYQKALSDIEGCYFPYQFSNVDIEEHFNTLFKDWKSKGNLVTHGSIDSEIQCLSCRSAMYLKAIELAKRYHYRYIAEGARMCQKFMIEQPSMLKMFEALANAEGIQLLLPVLELDDNQALIDELLNAGLSSKGWESKCELGREPQEKKDDDVKTIFDYYENSIYPKLLYLKKPY